jgi:signal transduction histidine kinase
MVWQDLSEERDSFGERFIMSLIKKAEDGGGWYAYQKRDSSKVSYVKMVEKDGQKLMIGCGYYPHYKGDSVISLVKSGVVFFNDRIKSGIQPLEVFSNFNYSLGDFILGDLYLYAVTSDVLVLANGALPNDAGQNYYNHKDDKGVFFLRNMVNAMKDAPLGEGHWFEYEWFNATKKAYMERVTDSSGISYFIGCGYNPDLDREAAVGLVKKGYQFMKAHGKSSIAQHINDQTQQDYRLGQLTLFIYDFMGNVIANGENIYLVGKNLYDLTDMSGRYMVREIIQKAKDEGAGWLDFRLHKSFYSVYIEEVDLGADKYVLGTGLYPITKESTMVLMVKSAKGFFKTHGEEESFRAFIDIKANFIRGDLSIFVLDTDGICYADGDRFDQIWKDLSNEKDDDGKFYIKTMLNAIKMGPANIIYKENGMRKIAYVESVKKGDKTYIIGSSFYL